MLERARAHPMPLDDDLDKLFTFSWNREQPYTARAGFDGYPKDHPPWDTAGGA
jgi:hypothetical protein